MPLKTVEPYTLMVDRTTGYVQALKPLDKATVAPDAALTQSFLVQYVIAREGFDMATLNANYRKVALFSAGAARTGYLQTIQVSNPQSPLVLYPRSTVIDARVKSVSPIGNNAALVRFDVVRTDAGAQPQPASPWVAVVRYRYSTEPMKLEDRFVNPLGVPGHELPPGSGSGSAQRSHTAIRRAGRKCRPAPLLCTGRTAAAVRSGPVTMARGIGLLLALLASTAWAQVQPVPGDGDPHLQVIDYGAGQIVAAARIARLSIDGRAVARRAGAKRGARRQFGVAGQRQQGRRPAVPQAGAGRRRHEHDRGDVGADLRLRSLRSRRPDARHAVRRAVPVPDAQGGA